MLLTGSVAMWCSLHTALDFPAYEFDSIVLQLPWEKILKGNNWGKVDYILLFHKTLFQEKNTHTSFKALKNTINILNRI